jgi:hypothetical protein
MAGPADTVSKLSPSPVRAWHWMVPSMTQWLWVIILFTLLAQPWRTMMVASDGDPCMHWRTGEWMLEHRQILRTDIFSHTRFGQPIITKEWLSEILFATGGRIAGLYGLAVVAALIIATAFSLLHRQLLRETGNHFVALFVTLIAIWAACTHWLARPHVVSFLFAVLWSSALRRYERDAAFGRLGVVLTLLTLLWVNLHGGYLAGFITLGVYWFGSLVETVVARSDTAKRTIALRKLSALSLVVVSCVAISLVNPNGFKLHLHNLQFVHSSYLTNWLAEYASTDFHGTESRGFLAWLLLTFLTLVYARPRLSPASGILLIVWTYFALYAARNVALLAIFTAPIIASALAEAAPSWAQRLSQRLRETHNISRGWVFVGAVTVAIVVPARTTEMPPKDWPVAAVAFIRTHPDAFAGNVFNQYAWGGYLMQYLPEHCVFIDGRTDFYGTELIRTFDMTTRLGTNWATALDNYNVTWTLMPTDHRLNLALGSSPNWRCIYSNEVATIYSRER